MTSDRVRQQKGTVSMSVIRIDRDDVGLGDVGVAMGVVCAGVVDVVQYPLEAMGAIQLNKALRQSFRSGQNFQAAFGVIGTIRFGWDQAWKDLP